MGLLATCWQMLAGKCWILPTNSSRCRATCGHTVWTLLTTWRTRSETLSEKRKSKKKRKKKEKEKEKEKEGRSRHTQGRPGPRRRRREGGHEPAPGKWVQGLILFLIGCLGVEHVLTAVFCSCASTISAMDPFSPALLLRHIDIQMIHAWSRATNKRKRKRKGKKKREKEKEKGTRKKVSKSTLVPKTVVDPLRFGTFSPTNFTTLFWWISTPKKKKLQKGLVPKTAFDHPKSFDLRV